MNGEQLHEKGIVLEVSEGKAKVQLITSASCEECSAKVFCKPKDENSNVLEVIDPIGVRQGDEVTINIEGSDLVKVSLKLYGIPLILLVAGIIIGLALFENNDLFAFLLGAGITAFYYLVLFILSKKSSKEILPKIILVK